MRPCLAVTLTHCWNESVWGRVARVVAAGVPDTPQIVRPEPRKPRMRQHRLNEAQVAALVADYQSGMSTGELARKYVVDTETAARWLKLHGVFRAHKPGMLDDQMAEVRALRDAGWTYTKIGARYGCSRTTVANVLKRASDA